MRYKEFKDGVQLSRLGMGTMRLPILDNDNAKIDYEKAAKLVDDCMEQGVNHVTQPTFIMVGKSEEFLKSIGKISTGKFLCD